MNILEKYFKEAEKDTELDLLNLRDKELMIPGLKHKWVSRLIQHRIELGKLKKLKTSELERIIEEFKKEPTITLTVPVLLKKAEEASSIKNLNTKIEENEMIISYIEKINDILKSMSWDIKNLIDTMKLEET